VPSPRCTQRRTGFLPPRCRDCPSRCTPDWWLRTGCTVSHLPVDRRSGWAGGGELGPAGRARRENDTNSGHGEASPEGATRVECRWQAIPHPKVLRARLGYWKEKQLGGKPDGVFRVSGWSLIKAILLSEAQFPFPPGSRVRWRRRPMPPCSAGSARLMSTPDGPPPGKPPSVWACLPPLPFPDRPVAHPHPRRSTPSHG
jgi:hypothetical protein